MTEIYVVLKLIYWLKLRGHHGGQRTWSRCRAGWCAGCWRPRGRRLRSCRWWSPACRRPCPTRSPNTSCGNRQHPAATDNILRQRTTTLGILYRQENVCLPLCLSVRLSVRLSLCLFRMHHNVCLYLLIIDFRPEAVCMKHQ